jgi:hypothetical protein
MQQIIAAKKKRKLDPILHFEGESDVEENYDNETLSEDISAITTVKK